MFANKIAHIYMFEIKISYGKINIESFYKQILNI